MKVSNTIRQLIIKDLEDLTPRELIQVFDLIRGILKKNLTGEKK